MQGDVYFRGENYPELSLHRTHNVEFKLVETDREKSATDIHVLKYDE